MTNTGTLSGENAFRLYDTYGFPLDLTRDILEEQGLSVDEETFQKEMQSQRERARAARADSSAESWKEDIYAKIDWSIKTKFVGYESNTSKSTIKAIIRGSELTDSANQGEEVNVILDITPFYAEMGGQAADNGKITGEGFELEVKDCKKVTGDRFAHICKVTRGQIKIGDSCIAEIDSKRRMAIARNHSTTHLLHKALRKYLGTHVEQAGSLVTPDRLRFDFSHFKGMTKEELDLIEKEVNGAILDSLEVTVKETPIAEAKKLGAMALFGEKYGDMVRVVTMGDYSVELCGGTHLKTTSQAGFFKILSEGGIAAGVRRIEAVTGEKAYEYVKEEERLMNELCDKLKAHPSESVKKMDTVLKQLKESEKEISILKSQMAVGLLDELAAEAKEEKGVKYLVTKLDNMSIDSLREMGDKLRDKLGTSFVLLTSFDGEKTVMMAMASKDAVAKGVHSGSIIKETAKLAGGSGGGRPDMAQGGIKDADRLNSVMAAVPEILKNMIK
jgi:alanyl-tRNA synthetase